MQAVVARSTFRSQKCKKLAVSDHFWKLRCQKSARRCGAKHISKSKCTKHTRSGPLLAVEMSKKCTPLWHEAHFEVKMYKTHHSRTTFGGSDVEKVHAVVARSTFRSQKCKKLAVSDHFWKLRCQKMHAVVARSTFPSQNVQNTPGPDHFWQLRCRKSARRCGAKHILKSKCTKHPILGPLLEAQMSKKCTPLWREAHFQVKMLKTLGVWTTFGGSDVSSLRFTTIDDITLHYTPLHYTTLHNTTTTTTQLHSTTLHYTKLHYTTLHSTTLHYTTLPSTTLDYITLHYTTLHYTTLHCTILQLQLHNYTPLHYITLHYTTFHYT